MHPEEWLPCRIYPYTVKLYREAAKEKNIYDSASGT
jgi:hypothetical protein